MENLIITVLLLIFPSERDSILAEIPGNAGLWMELFRIDSGETLEHTEYLFKTMTRTDREDMTLEILEDHVFGAEESRDIMYDSMPDSIFFRYLLQYRIRKEPLSSYRTVLSTWWNNRLDECDDPADIATLVDYIIENSFLEKDCASLQAFSDPLSVLETGAGSREELWILTGASLRSLGFAVRPVKGWFAGNEGLLMWFDIWTDTGWLIPGAFENLRLAVEYPSAENVTWRYTDTGILKTLPLGNFIEENWNVTLLVPSEYDTLKLDEVEMSPFEPDSVSLGAGPLLVQVSFTHDNGLVDTWLHRTRIVPDSITIVRLSEALYSIIPLP